MIMLLSKLFLCNKHTSFYNFMVLNKSQYNIKSNNCFDDLNNFESPTQFLDIENIKTH